MDLHLIGINHRLAPVALRERLALPGDAAGEVLRRIHGENVLEEALVLDTCNRTEVYFVPLREADFLAYFLEKVAEAKGGAPVPSDLGGAIHRSTGADAVEHLFEVAGALDSQVLGEHQLLGQLKDAYRVALEARTAGFFLNKLMHHAFRVGKRIRSETHLGRGTASIAQAAAELALAKLDGLAGKQILLVGAGETARLLARALVRLGADHLVVANRTGATAAELVRHIQAHPGSRRGGHGAAVHCPGVLRKRARGTRAGAASRPQGAVHAEAVGLDAVPGMLAQVDVVIASTGAPEPVIRCEDVAGALARRSSPLCIIDVAVPRDVDERVGDLDNVTLLNIDDLGEAVQDRIEVRRREIPRARALVAEAVASFNAWWQSRQVAPTIALLEKRVALLKNAELDRYRKNFPASERTHLASFSRGLCSKILHGPVRHLHELARNAPTGRMLAATDMIRQMFDLDELEEDT